MADWRGKKAAKHGTVEHPCDCGRRDFLKGAVGLTGGLAALGVFPSLSRLVSAQAVAGQSERYFVFCYFGGGWDILLSLDPRDPQRFNDGNLRTTLIQPGYDRLVGSDGRLVEATGRDGSPIFFGPYIGDLVRHMDRLAVVRGMSMETLTHEVGRRRFLTGKPPSGLLARGSSAATWLASRLGEQELVPNLSIQVESYNAGLPHYASGLRVNGVNDLVRALSASDPALPEKAARQVSETLKQSALCPRALSSPLWQAAEAARAKATEMTQGNMDRLFDLTSNDPDMVALRAFYDVQRNRTNTAAARVAVAAQALMSGVSRCVSLQIVGGLDAHFDDWSTDHGPRQQEGFDAVARLVDHLESVEYKGSGSSWMDHTTILGFSEFSRTALLNARGGRDHSLTNACFVLGAGVRGGVVSGQSSDVGMTPVPVNLESGERDPAGSVVRPEHVLQGLFEQVGITEEADLRVSSLRSIFSS